MQSQTSDLLIRQAIPPATAAGSNAANGEPASAPPRPADKSAFLEQRLTSLDVYRGLIMITLAFGGFGLARTAQLHLEQTPDSAVWRNVHYHFEHVEWTGCGYWDMIQPSFMFMVGVAMAFSYLKRQQRGDSYGRMLGHATVRALVLIFLGIFLISNWSRTGTTWSLMNVLSQIGLGYVFLFLMWGRRPLTQFATAVGILVVTWLLYTTYPYAGIDLQTGNPEVGVSKDWAQKYLAGVDPHWHKNANVGHAIDLWLLNKLPQNETLPGAVYRWWNGEPSRAEPFRFNSGGYQTINFLPSLATMIFGLMCGELLRSRRSAANKLAILIGAGLSGLALGVLLHVTGVCPIVKRIWTPAWTLYSTGWCCLILATLYALVDVLRVRWWTFPLVVVGVNSIAIYCMGQLLKPWAERTWQIHLGRDVYKMWGPLWEPTLQMLLIGGLFWLICLWMYRQKIFVRI